MLQYKQQKKASMVITCYNKQEYIGRMLDSVIIQKYDNIEVIIVNDGSTDGSLNVINRYIPKLEQRGYQVVIINQENRGRAPALKSGLLRVTGEYVCFPDGDDILLDNYVSAPINYMNEHSDVDFVINDAVHKPYISMLNPYLKKQYNTDENLLTNKQLLHMILLDHDVMFTISTIVMKTAYIDKCNIAANISDNKLYTQEIQVILPLLLGGGHMYYQKEAVYNVVTVPHSVCTSVTRNKKSLYDFFYSQHHKAALYILKKYNTLTDMQAVMLYIRVISRLHRYHPSHFNEHDSIRELLDIINIEISSDAIHKAGFMLLHYYTANVLCELDTATIKPIKTNCIIAYGAFGKAAKQIQTALVNSDIKPSMYWDIAAKQGDMITDVPVLTPDFESLMNQNDITVIILLKKSSIAEKVTIDIRSVNPKVRILFYFDVMDYLANYYFSGTNVKIKYLPGEDENCNG